MMQNVRAENAISFGVSDELDHSFHVIAAKRAAVGAKWKSTNSHLDSLLLRLIFREPNTRQFGIRVYDTGDGLVVHVAGLARNDFHASDSFVFSFVGQHGPSDHIADGINTFDVGAEMFVHFDASLFIQLDARFLRAQTIREWATPN